MAIANPRIHMICGICGSNKDLSFHIDPKGKCNNDGIESEDVFITCGNCSSLTALSEIIEHKEVRNDRNT